MYNIIPRRKLWYTISLAVLIPGLVALGAGGLKLGIDFTGGSLLTLNFESARPSVDQILANVDPILEGEILLQPSGDKGVLLRTQSITEEQQAEITDSLSKAFGQVEEVSFESIGPTIGKELRQKSILAIFVVLLFIIAYIAFAFRKVASGPIRSWTYGLVAVIALVHDIFFVVGIFALLGWGYGIEVGALFVTALLTTLGFSVHDTIVVFDRVRERLRMHPTETFEQTVNSSINQTLVRSINTSMTAILVLLVLYFFGGESISYFVLALILGLTAGTYSSIFVASPLLVTFQRFTRK